MMVRAVSETGAQKPSEGHSECTAMGVDGLDSHGGHFASAVSALGGREAASRSCEYFHRSCRVFCNKAEGAQGSIDTREGTAVAPHPNRNGSG